jgi:uncharacterized protein (DUF934 family)
MPKLIKDRQIIDDQWVLIRESSQLEDLQAHSGQDLIVPLAFWLAEPNRIQQRSGKTAVWLNSNEVPQSLGTDMHNLEVIALSFPIFSDGRSYTSARELRSNLGYKGEIRAIGDVLRDQLFYMSRCGFDAFLMREDQNLEGALAAFNDFSEGYQASVDKPIPLFRRR